MNARAINSDRLVSVQYLRAFAALLVVAHHARNPIPGLFNPLVGYPALAYGVDIFFGISGFIMVVSAIDDRVGDFVVKRLIRIVPLYWGATLTLALITVDPSAIPWRDLGQSLLFIPHWNLDSPPQIWPFLVAGWTLNLEVFFYAVFALGLWLGRPRLVVPGVIVGFVVLGWILNPSSAIGITYTSWILLEFVAGLLIGLVTLRGWVLPKSVAVVAVSLGLFLLLGADGVGFDDPSPIDRLVSVILILGGGVALNGTSGKHRYAQILGDASYSIYLVHTVIGLRFAQIVFDKIWQPIFHLHGVYQFVSWMAIAICVCALIGVLTYYAVERPLLRLLRSRLMPAPRYTH